MEEDMNKQKVKAKGTVGMDEVIGYLEDILNGMKSGRLSMDRGGEQIVLTPRSDAEVEIEAERKEGKQELSFEFKWKDRIESGRKLDLKISSEPVTETVSGEESGLSASKAEDAGVHPEEELRYYAGTEAFGSEPEEYRPRA
jgi:amphi-Trp domain-containing protein